MAAKSHKGPNDVDVIVHADDYGITPEQSRRILSYSSACGGDGALNSLSVIVGSPRFAECADILQPHVGKILVGLHFNLVEGPCCADPESIPLLVDEQGVFNRGFGGMLLLSTFRGKDCRTQVAREAAAQLQVFCERFPQLESQLRVDSHQHFHMIPAVFDGLLDALAEGGYEVEYIRIPFEPTRPFVEGLDTFKRVLPVNWVKHFLLNALWRRNRRKVGGIGQMEGSPWRKAAAGVAAAGVFCGINFSGHMTQENVESVIASFRDAAAKAGRPLELLFHPGGIERESDCLNPALAGFVAFYRSPFRSAEGDAVRALGRKTPRS